MRAPGKYANVYMSLHVSLLTYAVMLHYYTNLLKRATRDKFDFVYGEQKHEEV